MFIPLVAIWTAVPRPNNAFHQLVSDPFVDWNLGVRMTVPIGFRAGNANVRAAKLALERSYLSLRTDEDKAERFLEFAYRQVVQYQQQIQVQHAAFRAATTRTRESITICSGLAATSRTVPTSSSPSATGAPA